MAKIAIITDVHFGVRNSSQFYMKHQVDFYQNVFFPTIERLGIHDALFLGDFWDDRKKLDILTLNNALDSFFEPMHHLDVRFNWIYGNHDVYYRNTNAVNSIDFLEKMYPNNLHVVKEAEVIDIDGYKVGMVSWINKANLDSRLEFIRTASAPMLCGHFEIKSFQMLPGVPASSGLDKDLFSRYDIVLSGHFHTISKDGNVQYISNPFQTTWSDYGQEKGFRIFDTETRELTFVHNPKHLYSMIQYDDDIDLMGYDYGQHAGTVTRVYITSFQKINQQKFNLFIEKLNTVAHAVDVFEKDATVYNSDVVAIQTDSTPALVNQYIDEAIENENIDKDELKQYFNTLWKDAENSTITMEQ